MFKSNTILSKKYDRQQATRSGTHIVGCQILGNISEKMYNLNIKGNRQ